MIHSKLPKAFRIKVTKYLSYVLSNKKDYKLDEDDVLEMLNDNLRLEMLVHLNGKMLHDTPIFTNFDL
jgi:hypothetical protein